VKKLRLILLITTCLSLVAQANPGVRLKDIARIQDDKAMSLVGYGLVIGLSGSGDSARNKMTIQSLKNTLSNFGLMLDEKDIISKNVAAVMVTAKVSSFTEKGDQFDISVSSIGDAKSLTGGTLMLMPLYGVDQKIYAFSQGQLTVGGYDFEQDNNSYRKNHTTVGRVVKGATMERSIAGTTGLSNEINIILNDPDYTTATKVMNAIKSEGLSGSIVAVHPGKLALQLPSGANKVEYISRLEGVMVQPDASGKVVINERTGTIVAGNDVVLGSVSIAQGNLKVEIKTRYTASQPTNGFFNDSGVQSIVLPEVDLSVEEKKGQSLRFPEGTTVSDLVVALNKINVSTREIITILQSIKTAGALHADLVIE
jgi:flagellar P-ring protein precursor FlgI